MIGLLCTIVLQCSNTQSCKALLFGTILFSLETDGSFVRMIALVGRLVVFLSSVILLFWGRRQFENGVIEQYGQLISSIPLPDLIPMVKGAPQSVLDAAAKLACTTCVTVNIGLARDDFTPATWTYIYDEDIVFTRLSFPHKMSTKTCPPGCGSVQAECYYSNKYRPLDVAPEDLIQPVIDDLVKIGLITEDEEILHKDARLITHANIIFDLDREEALPIVHKWLDEVGITYVGRFGEWGYQWTDEAFKSGERGARTVLETLQAV